MMAHALPLRNLRGCLALSLQRKLTRHGSNASAKRLTGQERMAFRFKLQKVLEYREQLEDQAKVALARVQQLHIEEERRNEALKALLTEQETALYSNALLPAGERWLLERFILGVRDDLQSSYMRLRTLAQMVAEARITLRERAKDKKVLEKLKTRQRDRHEREERIKEQRSYDETATLRFQVASF
jgi:flagellar FliJ protein